MEIKSVTASVYFSSDVANPDTYPHFSTDIQMYTTTMTQPDPELFMHAFTSWEVASKENKWQGRNITRWRNEEYDKLYKAAEGEMDPVKRAAHVHQDERPRHPERGRDPGGAAAAGARRREQAAGWSRAAGTRTSGTCRTGTARRRQASGDRARRAWSAGPR